jgi:hypothetical protein
MGIRHDEEHDEGQHVVAGQHDGRAAKLFGELQGLADQR